LPLELTIKAGFEKVVPPAVVEGVISKALLTLYCLPTKKL